MSKRWVDSNMVPTCLVCCPRAGAVRTGGDRERPPHTRVSFGVGRIAHPEDQLILLHYLLFLFVLHSLCDTHIEDLYGCVMPPACVSCSRASQLA